MSPSQDPEAQDGGITLPRTVTIEVPEHARTRIEMTRASTLTRPFSRHDTVQTINRIPVEFRTLSLQVQDRDDLRLRHDNNKRNPVKGV
jgi:hypothetical protein